MNADFLIDTLNFIHPLSSSCDRHLRAELISESHPKKELLLKVGQTARKIYFINKGFARAYYYTKEGRECTCWFMGRGDLMISVHSFYTQQPAQENIEILEEAELLSLKWSQLQTLYADHPEFNYTGRRLTEKYYLMAEERAILLRTLTATERYERLLQTYPGISQKATLGQIASYLGISPETLSRIRNSKTHLINIKKTAP
jgi:CRP-like cAMP-binding protein